MSALALEGQVYNRMLAQVRARQREIEERRFADQVKANAEAIRERCVSLAGFVKEAWHVLEPSQPLVWGWHMDALCAHLEAITRGEITRLLANVPPGSSKSLIVSVLWQCWEWGPMGLSSNRFLTTAFNDGPVKRDSRKARDLILSRWYQELWPAVRLVRTGEMSFANSKTGTREGVAFGSLTSQRGDRLIIDDPHSTKTAESDVERANTTRQFQEGALNRLNDQVKSAIVVIMQRLHSKDLAGVILTLGMDFVHLMLPMEFEPARKCKTRIGFEDPRTFDGELLDPIRFPQATVDDLKSAKGMGSYAYAGQYQQRPVPREGGMFQLQWFEGRRIATAQPGTQWVRYWDLAGTELKKGAVKGARSAGVLMGLQPDGSFIVGDLVVAGKEGAAVRKLVKATAEKDGYAVEIAVSQDPGQAGKTQAIDYVKMLAGWTAHKRIETGDKRTRAEPFSAQCEVGNVWLLEPASVDGAPAWLKEYLDEICMFPGGDRKDIADASSGAFKELLRKVGGLSSGLAGPLVVDLSEEEDREGWAFSEAAPGPGQESDLIGYD